jgi:cardiolipin synthase
MAAFKDRKKRPYMQTDEVQLIHSGEDFFRNMEAIISSARSTIHFQTYIFDQDEAGKRIANALKAASARGVTVYMVIDAFGSKLSEAFVADLRRSGIRFKWFAPFMSRDSFHFGRRLHHKVLVADHEVAIVGGINISAKYLPKPEKEPWLDYAVMIRGSVCIDVERICFQILKKRFNLGVGNKKNSAKTLTCVRSNDRLRGKNQIANSYLQEIKKAKKSIVILGSYFIPGSRISSALIKAANRGVSVKIIVSGVSDVPVLGRASRFLYGQFLKNNIGIYEWTRSILHGKLAVIDDNWCTIGSFNLNHLSAFSSIEMNVNIIDRDFAKNLREHLEEVISSGCRHLQYESYVSENTFFERLKNTFSYFLIRFAMKSISVFPKSFFLASRRNLEF